MFFFLFFFFLLISAACASLQHRIAMTFSLSQKEEESFIWNSTCASFLFFFFNFTADGSFFFFAYSRASVRAALIWVVLITSVFHKAQHPSFFFFAFRAIHLSLNVLCFYLERGKGGEGWVASLIYLQHKICDCARMGCCSALWGSPSF